MYTILFFILLVNIVVILIHISAQLFTLFDNVLPDEDSIGRPTGKVTIHVPVHNEPPDVVLQTLTHLERLDYNDYEVIVLDNNTRDESLFLPLKEFCEDRRQFRFYHYDNVKGYKAGALNICTTLSSADTTFFLVVDADYCVSSDIISAGLQEFKHESVGLVQFPQSYRNSKNTDCGLMMDYSSYFDLVLSKAHQINCPLPTGTLTFIRRETLDKLGGWKTGCITEDAELGYNLYKHNYTVRYSSQVVGKGLAPYDYNTLRKQRQRWIFGNFQILLEYLRSRQALNLNQFYGFFLQLTAWANFAGLTFLLLIGISIMDLIDHRPYYSILQNLAVTGILLHMVGKFVLYMVYAYQDKRYSYRTAASAWLIHLSLMYDGSFCWWKLLFGSKLPFITTNKFKIRRKFDLSYHAFIIPGLLAVELLVLGNTEFSLIAFTTGVLLFFYTLAPLFFLLNIKTNNYAL